jgi:ubiquinone/menaquinone biosynthesis C-methylase UbiE
MTFYDDRVLPYVIDVALGRPCEKTRARVASGLSGQVLEVGFGSGRNVCHYPSAVSRVWAVDPATGALRIAAKRIASSPIPVEFIGLDGQDLPLPDASVDHVLITWTLCTIPDAARALREVNRVLRPCGALHFVEHGRSADPRTARWQDRLTPAWGKVAGGCHLNRPILEMVAASGLTMGHTTHYTAARFGLFATMVEGTASKQYA